MKQKSQTHLFIALSMLFMLMPVMALAEKIPVAILRTNADGKTKTLTFTYAERPKVFAKRSQNGIHRLNKGTFKDTPEKYLDINIVEDVPTWVGYNKDLKADVNTTRITKVIFDKSFSQARPTSTFSWFSGMKNLKTIIGLENLNTSNVKYMSLMFNDCSSLKRIDMSGFNTCNVEEMTGMFSGCTSLDSLDVSGFNTSNVECMASMFNGCEKIAFLDISGFKMTKVINAICMFNGCSNLKFIDLKGFDTPLIYNAEAMFKGCNNLTTIDISGVNMKNVAYMNEMFANCTSLTKMYVGNNDLTNLQKKNAIGESITESEQKENAFQKIGTFDAPCQLIIGPNFNKSVLGVKHENGKGGFYRWLGGYFTLEALENNL